jgi:DNA (cytosine-5)-methyltransferase 1
MDKMKVLNLYSGIGGNRKLWKDVDVTAVEYNQEIAGIYKEYFPDDKIIVADAHEYLLKHYKEFDFIWCSRSCITHSRSRFWASKGGVYEAQYPDFGLYEEITFLKHFAACKWVAENVKPYYEPLIKPDAEIGRHLFWANFKIKPTDNIERVERDHESIGQNLYGFDLSNHKIKHRKDQIMRNLVNPDLGLYIFEQAQGIIRATNTKQQQLF